jgi:hypothetical protein
MQAGQHEIGRAWRSAAVKTSTQQLHVQSSDGDLSLLEILEIL